MKNKEENYRLLVFQFKYVNHTCIWPLFFEVTNKLDQVKSDVQLLDSVVKELSIIPGIKDVRVAVNKYANVAECRETIDSILKDDNGNLVNSEDCKVKYLMVDELRLSDNPKYDYESGSFYKPVILKNHRYPVRVRSAQFKFLLDDLELPLITINSTENKT